MRPPRLHGRSLVNVIAELEHRLTGSCQAPRLDLDLAEHIPDAATYVLVLFDGLGAHQLNHEQAGDLAAANVATIDAPFPSTTTVSLSSIATGMTASQHGIIGYLMNLPDHGVVNMLKWTTPGGVPIEADTSQLLPTPNLWERLKAAGIEPICVQPGNFERTPLTRALYRGARYESVWNDADIVDATAQLASEPGRLIFTYVPHVDVAAHVGGQKSDDYGRAVRTANSIWQTIANRLPEHAVMIGTADHGHLDYAEDHKLELPTEGLTIFGEPRAVYVKGVSEESPGIPSSLAPFPATWIPKDQLRAWLGNGPPHPELERRLPDGVLLPDPGYLLLTSYMDNRLIGMHGGLEPGELEIPLLVARPTGRP
ncbi:MAG: alkaline phosphatase family protein [Acidimicrobiia bacterium]|nr:alkaline phosphatase family protein [Acidimicrobiia bacterium]